MSEKKTLSFFTIGMPIVFMLVAVLTATLQLFLFLYLHSLPGLMPLVIGIAAALFLLPIFRLHRLFLESKDNTAAFLLIISQFLPERKQVTSDVLYNYYLMQLEVWEEFVRNNPDTGYIETVHVTGTLITWMAQEHPEWLKRFTRLVRGNVTGNRYEKPHMELFVSPYFESLASTLPIEEAIRQTRISIDAMNFFGMKPSGYWLVERIWEPGYFTHFTKELRKLGINKAAIDDHLFFKMSEEEIAASGFTCTSFTEKDLRGYF